MSDLETYMRSLGKRIAALERICGIYAEGNFDAVDNNDVVTIANGLKAWAAGTAYTVGELRTEAGMVYKCRQAHTSTSTWQPSATPTLWEPVDTTHAGTLTDPIPWTSGMTAYLNKYYSEGGKTYRCKRDDTGNGTALYYTIAQLLGDYFEVAA